MGRLNKTIIILCEGSSEFAYIQELNKYFRENNKGLVFHPKLLDGGDYSNVKKKFREIRKTNPKNEIEVFVDFDKVCKSKNHHINPLLEDEYLRLYRDKVFKDYTKGSFPLLSITTDKLDNLFRHNKDNNLMFKSDFAIFIEKRFLSESNGGK